MMASARFTITFVPRRDVDSIKAIRRLLNMPAAISGYVRSTCARSPTRRWATSTLHRGNRAPNKSKPRYEAFDDQIPF